MKRLLFAVLLCAFGAAACAKKEPPPAVVPDVLVTDVIQRDEPIYSEWIGTLDGFVNAEIHPKVEGYLLKQAYREGTLVRQGDTLFQIDPRQFQAALDQSKGILARSQARLAKAKVDVDRYTPLVAQQAVSQQELDNALAAEREASAAVDAARANVAQAQLNLDWSRVTSPITGVVGIALAQVGDLVNPQTLMTTVSQVDPIKVHFNISEKEYLRYAERINDPGADPARQGNLELVLDDGSVFPEKGKVLVANRQVDVRTGTMEVRGSFANPGNILRPGQYAKVRATMETKKGALLVPQRAVSELQGAYLVGVVGADGKADLRPVQPAERIGSLWIIDKGLQPGEKVIVEGLAFVKPGMTVNAKPAPPEEAAPATAPKPPPAAGH
jgi:membrane fusion protein, multidrug efflux system